MRVAGRKRYSGISLAVIRAAWTNEVERAFVAPCAVTAMEEGSVSVLLMVIAEIHFTFVSCSGSGQYSASWPSAGERPRSLVATGRISTLQHVRDRSSVRQKS